MPRSSRLRNFPFSLLFFFLQFYLLSVFISLAVLLFASVKTIYTSGSLTPCLPPVFSSRSLSAVFPLSSLSAIAVFWPRRFPYLLLIPRAFCFSRHGLFVPVHSPSSIYRVQYPLRIVFYGRNLVHLPWLATRSSSALPNSTYILLSPPPFANSAPPSSSLSSV